MSDAEDKWYAAHLIVVVRYREGVQDDYSVYENIVLLAAPTRGEADKIAIELGHEKYKIEDDSTRWNGRPAVLEFAGVRKVVECEDPRDAPTQGTEVTYNQLDFASADALNAYLAGREAIAKCVE